MHTIWKFPLTIESSQTLHMPAGAKALSVQFQGHLLCLWAMVDSDNPKVERKVCIVGTGNPTSLEPIDTYHQFVGTVQEGPFVWHVFIHLE